MTSYHRSHRHFDVVSVRPADAGYTQRAAKTTCCRCGDAGHVVMTGVTAMPPEAIKQKFNRAGWLVDVRREGHDLCPKCIHEETEAHRKKKVVTMEKSNVSPVAVAGPRVMTREDRRLIFVRLNEVYESEATGYAKGFSDKAVAAELAMPMAWVATVRDENFGPHRENEEIRAIADAVAKLRDDQQHLAGALAAVQKQHDLLSGKLDDLVGRAKKLAA